jgi:hypothetical protein
MKSNHNQPPYVCKRPNLVNCQRLRTYKGLNSLFFSPRFPWLTKKLPPSPVLMVLVADRRAIGFVGL